MASFFSLLLGYKMTRLNAGKGSVNPLRSETRIDSSDTSKTEELVDDAGGLVFAEDDSLPSSDSSCSEVESSSNL